MTAREMSALVWVEYRLCAAHGELTDLIASIQPTGLDGAARSCCELNRCRRLVRRVLRRLSKPIAAKAAAYEGAAER